MALIAVLWITAALSLLAMSLSQMARTDLRVVGVFKQSTEAQARADGALVVVADWLMGQISTLNGTKVMRVDVGGVSVPVQIVPSTGFININMANSDLLRDMFIFGAGLPREQASVLAQNVVSWRTPLNAQLNVNDDVVQYQQTGLPPPRHAPFITPQDIRQVLGVTPAIYARIAPLIVANQMAVSSLVDPSAAPPGVLQVLAAGDEAVVARILSARAQRTGSDGASMPPVDTSGLNPAYLESVGSTYFRLTAVISGGDGLRWVRNWWVDYSMQSQGMTPWKVTQIESLRSAGFDR
ncbi:MAG: type II secretion system minor pseudopilin [Halothiobacillus sp.]